VELLTDTGVLTSPSLLLLKLPKVEAIEEIVEEIVNYSYLIPR
jgi:hypothetical protein